MNPNRNAKSWYGKACGSGQGLIIDEQTGANIAVAYEAANAPLLGAAPELLANLQALEARLTQCARAFYVDGTSKALKAAFEGWRNDIEPARAAIAKATE